MKVITLDVKSKIFAQYFGSEYIYKNEFGSFKGTIEFGHNTKSHIENKNSRILLKKLINISDEDAIEMAKIFGGIDGEIILNRPSDLQNNDIHFSAFNELNEDVFEEFDLKDLISESVDFFNDISITKNIQINSNLEDCSIKMDRTKTQKLVNNLISNSIKYSHKNSIIEINLENNILKVKDFGIGISSDEQKMIFKRYKRGNNIEGGFGIGLDIVKRVCEEYALPLFLESKINEQTVFTIDFSPILNKKKI